MENQPVLTCPVARRCSGSELCCSARLPAHALVSGKAILATGNFAPLSPTKGSNTDEEVRPVSHKLFHDPPQHVPCPVAWCLCAARGVFEGLSDRTHPYFDYP